MVSVNNVGFSGDNYESTKQKSAKEKEETLISIFNVKGDDIFSVEEQKAAYNAEIDKIYNQFRELFDSAGFKLKEFKDNIFKGFKEQNIEDDLDKKFVEYTMQVGINKTIEEMVDVVKQQHAKKKEELLNDLELSINVKLLDFDASKEELDELLALFNSLIDPNNEQHVERQKELENLINGKFPE